MFADKQQIQLNHLYLVTLPSTFNSQQGTFKPYMFINVGTVDVYGCDKLTQPTALNDLILEDENTAIDGFATFNLVPNYMLIKQNSGTTTELIVSGLKLKDLGEL